MNSPPPSGLYTPMYDGATDMIPKSCSLNVGNTTQVIDMAVIRQWVDNQQPKVNSCNFLYTSIMVNGIVTLPLPVAVAIPDGMILF